MSNVVSLVTSQLVTELSALTSSYAAVAVQRSLFRPAELPAFTRYAIIVTPNSRVWEERRIAIAMIQYVVRLDLYLLVKNWDTSSDSLFGTTAGSLGIFELIDDVKDLLRISTLNGLIDKTYDEPGGDSSEQGGGAVEFQDTIQGFDSGEHAFVHRAKIPYVALTTPFCHPRNLAGVIS
jgi:hypothetical protein